MGAANHNKTAPHLEKREEDIRLASLAAAGDEVAQRHFVLRLIPSVRRTMSYMTRDTHLAEDLTQNVLLRLLSKADSFRGESSIEFWASRISSRVALNELKKLSKRRHLASNIPEPEAHFSLADEAAEHFMLKRKLADMLSKISEKQRIVLILKHIEGYSIEEISSIVGAKENTVRERLRVGRVKLRKALEKEPDTVRRIIGRKV